MEDTLAIVVMIAGALAIVLGIRLMIKKIIAHRKEVKRLETEMRESQIEATRKWRENRYKNQIAEDKNRELTKKTKLEYQKRQVQQQVVADNSVGIQAGRDVFADDILTAMILNQAMQSTKDTIQGTVKWESDKVTIESADDDVGKSSKWSSSSSDFSSSDSFSSSSSDSGPSSDW